MSRKFYIIVLLLWLIATLLSIFIVFGLHIKSLDWPRILLIISGGPTLLYLLGFFRAIKSSPATAQTLDKKEIIIIVFVVFVLALVLFAASPWALKLAYH